MQANRDGQAPEGRYLGYGVKHRLVKIKLISKDYVLDGTEPLEVEQMFSVQGVVPQ